MRHKSSRVIAKQLRRGARGKGRSDLRIGTRGSELALTQARQVAAHLEAAGRKTEIVTITTSGDRREIPRDPADIGKALWTREIEVALADGEIDLAVHSLKDLPADLPEGLMVGAVLPREDPLDVLVSEETPRALADLPREARVGTGSIRRAASLRRARPDLTVVPLKGNVPTRLRKLSVQELDAIVLAAAGLNRLGLEPTGRHPLDPDIMPPALCQGIVAVEIREEDAGTDWVDELTDPETMTRMQAERALLATLGVGCGAPVGGLATVSDGRLHLFGAVLSPDGSRFERVQDEAPMEAAGDLGRRVGHGLMEGPAGDLLAELGAGAPPSS